jgi:Domain of unknown function (DUF4294)
MKYFSLLFLVFTNLLIAQEKEKDDNWEGIEDTLIYVKDGDTIKEYVIEEVVIDGKYSDLTAEEKEKIKLLERRVRVVYPYAKLTADKLTQINTTLSKLKNEKEKKKYLKLAEKYLNEEFEPKLKKLSQKQGQILIKLINRQTGISTYDLIKDYKSGWKAYWSSKTAKVFNLDLKKTFNPLTVPEDYYIETYLLECFETGKLTKQAAAKPVTQEQLDKNWEYRNARKEAVKQ